MACVGQNSHARPSIVKPESAASDSFFPPAPLHFRLTKSNASYAMPKSNVRAFREEWLQDAAGQLRPYFHECGLEVPEKIRFAVAFPSTGRKGNRLGETWHSRSSGDGTYEIIIRSDLAEPVEVLSVLVNKLVHTVVPDDESHGKKFRAVALKVGLSGKIHKAEPSPLLQKRLAEIAEMIGPLPHASLNINDNPMTTKPIDRVKKRGGRMLKAECPECAKTDMPYIIRIAATPAREIGIPNCPKHGVLLFVDWPEDEPATEPESDDAAE
jgi:hypothetical protein